MTTVSIAATDLFVTDLICCIYNFKKGFKKGIISEGQFEINIICPDGKSSLKMLFIHQVFKFHSNQVVCEED